MTGVLFKVVIGPPFARCACGMELAGRKCWRWFERGQDRYGCRMCMFVHANIEVCS
jgi:hypothetical protein